MPRFKIELTDDLISSNSGLVFVGEALHHLGFDKLLSELSCIKAMKKIPTTDILRAYLGILCIGKIVLKASMIIRTITTSVKRLLLNIYTRRKPLDKDLKNYPFPNLNRG